jgi:hypothetical protein
MKKVKQLVFVILATLLTVSSAFSAGMNYKADLSAIDEVQNVNSPAKGEAKFTLSNDGKSMSYTIVVRDIENPTSAHIHLGSAGKNGELLANLFSGPKREGKFRGNLAQASFTEADLKGKLKGKSLTHLVALIKSGDVYVNVHTDNYPDGEIRGQIN